MRIAIITESFAPDINGVANSVLRVAEQLVAAGHQPTVIAPTPTRSLRNQITEFPYPVVRVPSLPMSGYGNVRLALPIGPTYRALAALHPDVIHLASPFVLGAWGVRAARKLRLPTVAVYQTDVAGYTSRYWLGTLRRAAWWWTKRIHSWANITLVPSTATAIELYEHGVTDTQRWGRGVDTALYHPDRRSEALRRELAPGGELLVGYVGRLAREKCVHLLSGVADLPRVRVVIVGDGPTRNTVSRAMPSATFLGHRTGVDLARVYASLDVFVHTGPLETFCQTIQEAQASGVPVVAPASGGPVDLVQTGENGFLVRPGDPAEFATAIATLAADPAMRSAFGRAALAAVQKRTWNALCGELIDHYARAISATAGPAMHTGAARSMPATQVTVRTPRIGRVFARRI